MNREEFLQRIRQELSDLPLADLEPSLDYYREMIADRMEEGIPEEEGVAALGDPRVIAAEIRATLSESGAPAGKGHSRLPGWAIVLLAVGSPLWIAAAAVLLAVYITLWAVVVVFWAAELCLGVGALCGLVCFLLLLFQGHWAQAVLLLGGSFLCVGLTVLWHMGTLAGTKGLIHLTGWCGRKCLEGFR
ncbi:MAG: DUF1700 domain-containing protein [Oscillospiraceae bacterium]|nr:DUF1700 domain-containing protein [Oscillospiraceae bacterium]